jgi:S-adenosylmethionine/arginine decarboxylase-like enzyme
MKFDGKDYPEEGPTVAVGSTSSGRRLDERTIETTEKIKGRLIEIATATISPDGAVQTIVVTEPDDNVPVTLVYERETK